VVLVVDSAAASFGKGFSVLARLKQAKDRSSAFAPPQMDAMRPPELPSQKTGELMSPVPSVTEGTTRHLNQEPPTRHFDSAERKQS